MKILDSVPEKLWNDVAQRCESATFFHTYAWFDAVRKSFPEMRSATKAFQFGEDDWVVFPLMQVGTELRGFFKHYVSNEPGVYGGPIFNKAFNAERARQIFPHFMNVRTACMKIFGNPLFDLTSTLGAFKTEENSTHILNLSEFKDVQEISGRYARDVKKGIRDAETQRVECVQLNDLEGLKSYFSVYEEVTRLRGASATNQYPFDLFKNLFDRRNEGVKFWSARLYGKVIGGVISCEFNRHIDLWHAAWLPVAHNIGAGKLVYHKVIEYAFERGYKYFDFNPSGGHRGTMKLKEEFGCSRKEFNDFTYEAGGFWARYALWRPKIKKAEIKNSAV